MTPSDFRAAMAVDTGMLTFDGAFLGHLLLPTGKTVFETVNEQKLLPPPPDEKVVQIAYSERGKG